MLRFSEILPNPAGQDSGNEFVELEAVGAPETLSFYRLENGAGRSMLLSGNLPAGERLVVYPKFAIRNQNEKMILRRGGAIVDQAEFPGAAPEGRSYNRLGGYFLPGEPTPGAPNQVMGLDTLRNPYPPGELRPDAGASFVSPLLLTGALLAAYGMLILVHALPRDHHPLR